MSQGNAQFRFYEELNDFLDEDKRKVAFLYVFNGHPSIKDAIEAIGVPHTEVDLILVNGVSVGFDYQLQEDDRVSVYPVFESLDSSPLVRLREKPLRESKFVLDVHLGKLARHLRLLGFDACYDNAYEDAEIVDLAVREGRIVLTRDRGILKVRAVTHGYWVRSRDPMTQIREVLTRFDLFSQIRPFQRCIVCNGLLRQVEKQTVVAELPPRVAAYYDEFFVCAACGKVYWKGSHYDRLREKVAEMINPESCNVF